jgi:hypothetical protein
MRKSRLLRGCCCVLATRREVKKKLRIWTGAAEVGDGDGWLKNGCYYPFSCLMSHNQHNPHCYFWPTDTKATSGGESMGKGGSGSGKVDGMPSAKAFLLEDGDDAVL